MHAREPRGSVTEGPYSLPVARVEGIQYCLFPYLPDMKVSCAPIV